MNHDIIIVIIKLVFKFSSKYLSFLLLILNDSEDLRLTTSQETNGKAVMQWRSLAWPLFFVNFFSHCRFVMSIQNKYYCNHLAIWTKTWLQQENFILLHEKIRICKISSLFGERWSHDETEKRLELVKSRAYWAMSNPEPSGSQPRGAQHHSGISEWWKY